MEHPTITIARIKQFSRRLRRSYYHSAVPMDAEYVYSPEPIPFADIPNSAFQPIKTGTVWGSQWGSAWFRFTGLPQPGARPAAVNGQPLELVACIDLSAEACVFVDGVPWIGLTHRDDHEGMVRKRRVPLRESAQGEPVELLVEAAANVLFGEARNQHREPIEHPFVFRQADLVLMDRGVWQLALDVEFLLDLAASLDTASPRARKIISGLNRVCNVWNDGRGWEEAQHIVGALLSAPANHSASQVISVGHAHIDLAWLWPLRETRRKAGRTFATALRMLDEYPDYVFGTSQPQMLQWVQEDYPDLFAQVQKQIAAGRWECQGAMWVEPDINIPSGESLVRQCLYGKKYFSDVFGVDVRNLWLPDVFGYSGALPQILKQAGVDLFMTQKISWNETNRFPYHTFMWEGIDGTQIHAHFLPTNTYNFSNRPNELISSEQRFGQSGTLDRFLNLYGIGDGGGGPSREHIEFARRAENTEGLPRVTMAPAEELFTSVRDIAPEDLPSWRGELYLEMHRGTYTTQGKLKAYNRRLERLLHDVEFLSAVNQQPVAELEELWKGTLLNQFHDILPGSSITWVYEDAHRLAEQSITRLETIRQKQISTLTGAPGGEVASSHPQAVECTSEGFRVFNLLSWRREVLVPLSRPDAADVHVVNGTGDVVPTAVHHHAEGPCIYARVSVPPCGYGQFAIVSGGAGEAVGSAPAETAVGVPREAPARTPSEGVVVSTSTLENDVLRVTIADDGTIASLFRKDTGVEYLSHGANRFTLWEDIPYTYDAWDISHYYRETTPQAATLVHREVISAGGLCGALALTFTIGDSTIQEVLYLESGSPVVTASCTVDWRETHRHLRVGAETDIQADMAWYEIQFGAVNRTTRHNTSWDQAQFEVPAHRFADLSQPDRGLALMNDCKYGHRVVNGQMELTLLRSPTFPDPQADRGMHTFRFAYFPHRGLSDRGEVVRRAHEMNAPALIAPVTGNNASDGAAEHSWFSLSDNSVAIDTVKPAEDGRGVVLRMYEHQGTSVEVTLHGSQQYERAELVDLLENTVESIPRIDEGINLTFSPYQIRSVRLIG